MIEIVRAKNNENRLEVMDNRPFVIESEYCEDGILVSFYDIFGGMRKKTLWYKEIMDFKKEWEFINNFPYQMCSFDLINYYQE